MLAQAQKAWYLVFTKPQQEGKAQLHLERQGYITYLPRFRQVRRLKGQRRSVVVPLFPRYLFLLLDRKNDNWGPIRSTLGVVSVVQFGHEAARAPDSLIEFLKSRETDEGLQLVMSDTVAPGQRVRVTEGGLMGFEGVLAARTSSERVVVLLDIMGKSVRASVKVDALEPVSPPKLR